jgi:pimeloyl-ACP methyl ester carboxylesterase
MNSRRLGVIVLAGCLVLSACTTSSTTPSGSVVDTTVVADSVWTSCGDIECAQIEVPVDYSVPDGARMPLAVYRRESVTDTDAPPVVLVPDYLYGDTAQELIDRAPAHLGSNWTAHTLISISRRGTEDSPMPAGSEHLVSTRDVARDIDYVRSFLDLGELNAMGWGSGATALAVLAVENPDALSRMVLDSPSHPFLPVQDRVSTQISSDNAIVAEALRWCVSHISCSMNANVATSFNLFRTNTRIGIVDEKVTSTVVARAARAAFADADPQAFFSGISQATEGDSASLLSLAGAGASPYMVQALCADETREGAQLIAQQLAVNHADTNRFFSLGDDYVAYEQCAQLPDVAHPLDGLNSPTQSSSVQALVIVAENNPVTSSALSTGLAQQFSWTLYALPLWRHLLVGHDDPTTARAIEFLTR